MGGRSKGRTRVAHRQASPGQRVQVEGVELGMRRAGRRVDSLKKVRIMLTPLPVESRPEKGRRGEEGVGRLEERKRREARLWRSP